MCRIQQCFCCCDLRQGSFTSAVYTMVLGLLSIIVIGVAVGGIQRFKDIHNIEGMDAATIILIVTLVIYILWVISSIFLIIGVAKRIRGMMIPWMIMTIILTIFAAISIIIALVNITATFGNGATAFQFILQIVIFCFNVYALICVFSYYKDDCQEMQPSGGVKGAV